VQTPLQQGTVALHLAFESRHSVQIPSLPQWPVQHKESSVPQRRPESRRQQHLPLTLQ
jgi:hypothetical protein